MKNKKYYIEPALMMSGIVKKIDKDYTNNGNVKFAAEYPHY